VSYLEATPPTLNDAALTERVRGALRTALGEQAVLAGEPVMAAEDFGHYGRAGVPAVIFWLGAVPRERFAESRRPGGAPLPPLHSASFAPDPEASIRTGVIAMSAAVRELMGRKPN
jgi:hippurate hydrolase